MTMLRLAAAVALLLAAGGAHADPLHREELRIPAPGAGAQGLETLLVRPAAPGKYPLVLLSHGSPRNAADRKTMTPLASVPLANEFARRGFAVAIVMRRGYAHSGGDNAEYSGDCGKRNYVKAGRTSADDLRAAIEALAKRPDIDATRIVAVGISAGGFASVALTAQPPPGLVAAISFAGGRGSVSDFKVCQEDRLVDAFAIFGKTSRTPMLWVYAENDRFFAPPLAEKFRRAFVDAGGQVEFVKAGPFGKDGHVLFSLVGIPEWTPMVDAFLAKHDLKLRSEPAPLDLPPLTAPAQLTEQGRKALGLYLLGGPHKAFAVTPGGRFGWQTGRRSVEDAKSSALKLCREKDCRVVFVDDGPTP